MVCDAARVERISEKKGRMSMMSMGRRRHEERATIAILEVIMWKEQHPCRELVARSDRHAAHVVDAHVVKLSETSYGVVGDDVGLYMGCQ